MGKNINKDDLSRAKSSVYRLLKIRYRSEKEIRDHLTGKDIPSETIVAAVEYFKDLDLINDHLFARKWIESRLKRPFGLIRIQFELIQKGIDKEIIQEEILRLEQDVSEEEIVTQCAVSRAKKYPEIDPQKRNQRLFNYLRRRGFNQSTIIKVLNKI